MAVKKVKKQRWFLTVSYLVKEGNDDVRFSSIHVRYHTIQLEIAENTLEKELLIGKLETLHTKKFKDPKVLKLVIHACVCVATF